MAKRKSAQDPATGDVVEAKKPAVRKRAASTDASSGEPSSAAAAPARKKAARKGAKASARKSAKSGKKTPARSRAAVTESFETDDFAPAGTTSLVIVESPAKAKTIGKYLGKGYRVKATVGHIRDLPQKKLGIDVDRGFTPQYVTIPGKEKTLADLKSAAATSREIFIATDPDREGEAIAWHVAEQISTKAGPRIRRVLFHEITKDAIHQAIEEAGKIDVNKVDAQQARRVLDRLVGYKASPLLWKTVKKGISAGRVQTVALRLLVEREREIRAFKPVEYWTIEAQLEKAGQKFSARLHHIDGKKAELANGLSANTVLNEVEKLAGGTDAGRRTQDAGGSEGVRTYNGRLQFPVTDLKKRERRKNPSAPFTTSTLQQEAAKKLGYGSKRTMRLAQDLYEGIELGPEGAQGLITYMRTDSTRVSETAAGQARDYLRTLFGAEYLASGPQLFMDGKAKNTQDAHECVRPTDPTRRPDQVQRYLSPDQFKLYQLIWQRFMASQMAPAVFDTTTIDFQLGRYTFRSTGSVVKFQGFLALYREAHEEGESKPLEDEQALPVIENGERVPVQSITPSQHFTEPPPRYSEASLVKELERLGIGRPSTYASIISVLVERRYVLLEQRRFTPTLLGETVEKVMVKQFPDVFNVGFTSTMELELDKIEEGELKWQNVLQDFYDPFSTSLETVDLQALIGEAFDLTALADEKCPECGGALIPKAGFFGPYAACVNHPKTCKHTKKLGIDRKEAKPSNEICHECGSPMLIRAGRSGEFLGCSKFPKCRGTRPMPTGVKCPKDGGEITQRRSKKRGKAFYGCGNYPNCDFVIWDKPVLEVCPECGYEGAEMKSNKTRGDYRKCLKCANEWTVEPAPSTEAA